MDAFWQTIGPLSPIIGGVLGAAIGAIITYVVVVKRKAVVIRIAASEDITRPLLGENDFMIFKIGDRELLNLNRAEISVRNTGSAAIKDFTFEIAVPGSPKNCIAKVATQNDNVGHAVEVKRKGTAIFDVAMPFFNAKESYVIAVFFDGKVEHCKVRCRIEDVSAKIKFAKYRGLMNEPATTGEALLSLLLRAMR
jgi:hypothetical protein